MAEMEGVVYLFLREQIEIMIIIDEKVARPDDHLVFYLGIDHLVMGGPFWV